MSHLVTEYAKAVREERKLTPIDLARQMGLWKHPAKGAQRIVEFERCGRCSPEFFDSLTQVLGLDQNRIRELLAEETRQHEAWLDEPIPMELTVRYMPAFYVKRPVPVGLDRDAAIQWALAQARNEGCFKMCLRLSRRERIWISEGGASYQSEKIERGTERLPSMRLGERQFCLSEPSPPMGD